MPAEIAPSPDWATAILAAVSARGQRCSLCPSEVARHLRPQDWALQMPAVREAARTLAQQHRIEITQSGAALDPFLPWRGPIRLRLPRG